MAPTPGELDPIIHTQARLRIMTTLTALPSGDRITFPRLQTLLDATAGNLSAHLRKLEDAGYVTVTKGHVGRTPATHVEATPAGRRAFDDYLDELRALLTPPAEATAAFPRTPAPAPVPVPASDPPAPVSARSPSPLPTSLTTPTPQESR
ncbi:winged helix-turn-helix domain-containing protein [uncultured Cellulomonas sp.]|uniref:winged helix-turn-helix domain-containing protein n=1 Tax=uncultured Cellulomonas sp. TaxID=189682 RepID=UPI00345C40C1